MADNKSPPSPPAALYNIEIDQLVRSDFNSTMASKLLLLGSEAEDRGGGGLGDARETLLTSEQLHGTEDERRFELISQFGVTVHRQPRRRDRREEQEEKFNGRNIAIKLMPLMQNHLQLLKQDFTSTDEGYDVDGFCTLLYNRIQERVHPAHVPDLFRSEEGARTALKELYGAIEHEGTGRITWEPFLSYFIDATIMGPTGFDARKIVQKWEPKYSQRFAAAQLAREWEPLDRVQWCKGLARVICITREGILKLLNPTNYSLTRANWPVPGKVIACTYIKEFDRIVVSSSNMCLRIFDKTYRYDDVTLTSSQMCLTWSARHKKLYSGCRTGSVNAWSVTSGGSEGLAVRRAFTFQPHSAAVTDILCAPLDGSLITCSLDQTIVVSDPIHGCELQRYRGHTAGIIRIDFAPDYNLIISGAMETQVLVYVFGGGDRPKPFELIDAEKPHRYPICSVAHVPNSPQFISLDVKGMLKFWDIRTFTCTQTMYTGHNDLEKRYFWSDACVIGQNQYLTCSSKKTYVYQVDQGSIGKDKRCDDTVVTQSHTTNGTVVTVAEGNVKTWDVLTGEMLTDYRGLTSEVITCSCVDYLGKLIFLGLSNGSVEIRNLTNGAKVSVIEVASNKEIASLAYARTQHSPMVICAIAGGKCVLISLKHVSSPKLMHLGHCFEEVKLLSFCQESMTLVAATPMCNVLVWSSAKYTIADGMSYLGSIHVHSCQTKRPTEREIVSIMVVPSDSIVVIGVSNGEVCVVHSKTLAIITLFAVTNVTYGIVTSITKAIAYRYRDRLKVYTVDEDGVLSVLDLTSTLHSFAVNGEATPPKLVQQIRAHAEPIVEMCSLEFIGAFVTFSLDLQGIVFSEDLTVMGQFDRYGTSLAHYKLGARTEEMVQVLAQRESVIMSHLERHTGRDVSSYSVAMSNRAQAHAKKRESEQGTPSTSLPATPQREVRSRHQARFLDKKCNVVLIRDERFSPSPQRDDIGTAVDNLTSVPGPELPPLSRPQSSMESALSDPMESHLVPRAFSEMSIRLNANRYVRPPVALLDFGRISDDIREIMIYTQNFDLERMRLRDMRGPPMPLPLVTPPTSRLCGRFNTRDSERSPDKIPGHTTSIPVVYHKECDELTPVKSRLIGPYTPMSTPIPTARTTPKMSPKLLESEGIPSWVSGTMRQLPRNGGFR